jgi:hypothetical protein
VEGLAELAASLVEVGLDLPGEQTDDCWKLSFRMESLSFRWSGMVLVSPCEGSGVLFGLDDWQRWDGKDRCELRRPAAAGA